MAPRENGPIPNLQLLGLHMWLKEEKLQSYSTDVYHYACDTEQYSVRERWSAL